MQISSHTRTINLDEQIPSIFGSIAEQFRDYAVVKREDNLIQKIGKWSLGTTSLAVFALYTIVEAAIALPFFVFFKSFELIGSLALSSQNVTWLRTTFVMPIENWFKSSLLYIAITSSRIFTRFGGDEFVHSTDKTIWGCFPHLQLDTLNRSIKRYSLGGVIIPEIRQTYIQSLPSDVSMTTAQMIQIGTEKLQLGDEAGVALTMKSLSEIINSREEYLLSCDFAKQVINSTLISKFDGLDMLMTTLVVQNHFIDETEKFIDEGVWRKLSLSSNTSFLFEALISKNKCLDSALEFAIKKPCYFLLTDLVKKDCGFKEAINVIKKESEAGSLLPNSSRNSQLVWLLCALIEKGQNCIYEEGIKFINNALKNPPVDELDISFLVLHKLVQKGQGSEIAISMMEKWIEKNAFFPFYLREVCKELVRRNQYIPRIKLVVKTLVKDQWSACDSENNFSLLYELLRSEHGLDVCIEGLNTLIDNYSDQNRANLEKTVSLSLDIILREANYPKIIEFTQKLIRSPLSEVQSQALKLLVRLVNKGQAIDEARSALNGRLNLTHDETNAMRDNLERAINRASELPKRPWYHRFLT